MIFQPRSVGNCPSCGAPLQSQYGGAKVIVCGYCHQTSYINADSLSAIGQRNELVDYGSIVAIGKTIRLPEGRFQVAGRMRFSYPDGFWDEWFLLDEQGKECWLQEDEGDMTLFRGEKIITAPAFKTVQVGSTLSLLGKNLFVCEKHKAVVEGGEGELPFRVVRGEPADFIDMIYNEELYSLEYLSEGHILNIGKTIPIEKIGL